METTIFVRKCSMNSINILFSNGINDNVTIKHYEFISADICKMLVRHSEEICFKQNATYTLDGFLKRCRTELNIIKSKYGWYREKTIMKSKTQIVRELEGIVHQRFNFQTLTKKLSDIFGVQVELYCSEDEMVELLGDYCYTFAIGDSFGVFDIYYLPHKQIDENGNDLYVTEVGYSFGC